jgi:hypothetical protein
MTLDEMSIEDLTRMGKTHYLILSLLESAETRIENYPVDVSNDAKTINMQALESIAKAIEDRRGSIDRDNFLKEISSIFESNKFVSEMPEAEKKRLAKNKIISEAMKKKHASRKDTRASKKA